MSVIFRLTISFFVGLASHQLDKPTRSLGPKIGLLSKYAVGILTFIPLFIFVKHSLPKPNPDDFWADFERDAAAGLLTAGAQGTGVFLGYALDSHE